MSELAKGESKLQGIGFSPLSRGKGKGPAKARSCLPNRGFEASDGVLDADAA